MEKQKKQAPDTGNGDGKTPILANGLQNMAGKSKPSQPPTSIAANGTKPVSVTETLSLLQTHCLDLRSLGCEVALVAKGNRVYIIVVTPASIGTLTTANGHILANGVPVSVI